MSELISKDGAVGAVQDHFNADGFKGYDDGQKMMDRIKALPSVEATAKFAEFQEDIFKLEKELEYYQDRYEAVTRINDAQVETIRTYAAMVKMLEKELKEIKET